MTEYILHFALKKYKDAKRFNTTVNISDSKDIEEVKLDREKFFGEMFHTPVKCVKVEKVEKNE